MSGPDVVIVGGGPAGLAAAAALAPDLSVVVLDREDRAGGIPGTATTAASGCATCAGCSPDRRMPTAWSSAPWRRGRPAHPGHG